MKTIWLTCTAHGKALWIVSDSDDMREAGLPDRHVRNPPPATDVASCSDGHWAALLADGATAQEAAQSVIDVEAGDCNLDDPGTWAASPTWIQNYLASGAWPDAWTDRA